MKTSKHIMKEQHRLPNEDKIIDYCIAIGCGIIGLTGMILCFIAMLDSVK